MNDFRSLFWDVARATLLVLGDPISFALGVSHNTMQDAENIMLLVCSLFLLQLGAVRNGVKVGCDWKVQNHRYRDAFQQYDHLKSILIWGKVYNFIDFA